MYRHIVKYTTVRKFILYLTFINFIKKKDVFIMHILSLHTFRKHAVASNFYTM